MELETVILNEITQAKKKKNHISSVMDVSFKIFIEVRKLVSNLPEVGRKTPWYKGLKGEQWS